MPAYSQVIYTCRSKSKEPILNMWEPHTGLTTEIPSPLELYISTMKVVSEIYTIPAPQSTCLKYPVYRIFSVPTWRLKKEISSKFASDCIGRNTRSGKTQARNYRLCTKT